MADQLLMYDTAVLGWLTSNFGTLIAGKTLYKTIGTPDRAFAEYVTPTGTNPDGRPPLPRAALTVEDIVIDTERYNPAPIRLLGYSDATKLKLRRASYPTPVNLPYTLNFWTEYKREMNLIVQKIATLFRSGRYPISVNINTVDAASVYGTKTLHLVKEGEISNTGNLEPGTEERETRRTFPFYLEGWLWDIDFVEKYIVKQVALEARDYDLETLWEIKRTPENRVLWTGNGVLVTFGPTAVPFLPIVERTLILDATIGGATYRFHDDGAGALTDADELESGTVDYVTGEVTVEFSDAPDDDTDITVAYFTTVS